MPRVTTTDAIMNARQARSSAGFRRRFRLLGITCVGNELIVPATTSYAGTRPARGKDMFWYIDPAHTSVSFSVKHMMLSTVRGRLGTARGRIELDPARPEKGDFEITVQVKGITTGDAKRDAHLGSVDFFDAEKYPEIIFKSNAIFPKGDGHYTASGDLTIREITRPVSFDVELLRP